MADNQIELQGSTPDDEFWKRFSGVREMLALMKERAELIRRVRGETVIPEHARDLAIKALSTELQDNKRIFFDYLLNFISAGMQVLHRVDIEMEFSIIEGGRIEMDNVRLIVDKEILEVPVEIGARFIGIILESKGPKKLDVVLSFYREEEARYDKIFDGIMDRCSLQIMDELYPRRRAHIRLKLPAQSLIEYRVTL
ncbi:MAG: hypothetical protein NTV68_03255 [Methanomicrobiales archaeon]|nr:hypothetical protein [Methanomicrobiales archaeon]